MKFDDNEQMVSMLQHTKGSIENKIRQAYNSGYNDGFAKGVATAYADIRKAIEASTIRQYGDTFKWEVSADTPQTDCDKCIWSVCNYNKVDWDADTPQTDCGWMYDSRRDYEYDKALDEMERNE